MFDSAASTAGFSGYKSISENVIRNRIADDTSDCYCIIINKIEDRKKLYLVPPFIECHLAVFFS